MRTVITIGTHAVLHEGPTRCRQLLALAQAVGAGAQPREAIRALLDQYLTDHGQPATPAEFSWQVSPGYVLTIEQIASPQRDNTPFPEPDATA